MSEAGSGPEWHVSLAEMLARLPTPDGRRYIVALEHGTMEAGVYAPRGTDPQQPHDRDEVYVVTRGSGTFVHGEERHRFGPGDLLFAAAGVIHRFEDFTDDLALWVIFYGPRGGEASGPSG